MRFREFLSEHKLETWIFAVALVARLIMLFVSASANDWNFDHAIHGQDGYYEIARNIHDGKGFSWDGNIETPFHVPLFPYFLYCSLALFDTFVPAAIALIIIGSFIPVLARRLSLWITGHAKIAAFVGFTIALEPNFILYSTQFFTETFFISLFLIFVIVFLSYIEKKSRRLAFYSGIILGLAVLTKIAAQFMPIFLIPFAWLYLRRFLSGRELMTHAVLFFAAFFLIISPWLYRNYRTFDAIGLTVMPTYNLYTTLVPSVLSVVNGTSFADEQRAHFAKEGKDKPRLTFSNEEAYRKESLDAILPYKGAIMQVSLINVFTFFTHDGMLTVLANAGISPEVKLSKPALQYLLSSPVEFMKEASSFLLTPFVLVLLLRLFWLAITVLAFFGIYVGYKKRIVNPAFVLGIILVAYFAITTPSNGLTVNARFRMPVMPIILSIAAVGASFLYERWKPARVVGQTYVSR